MRDSLSTGTTPRISLFIGIILLTAGCTHHPPEKLSSGDSYGRIIYDTFIVNRDSTDSWGDECLAGFNRKALVDHLFSEVFAGRITPFDYFSGEKIPLARLQKMESEGEFSRKNISKIQFEERWIWDKENAEMQKIILSMTIAYEVFDNAGKSRGQKPIFKLVFHKD